MGQRRDFIMSEGCDAMTGGRLGRLVRPFGVLEGLPGVLMPGLMFQLPLLFPGAVGVRGEVVQLSGALMIFVVGSVVISGGHIQRVTFYSESHDLAGFGMCFLG